MIIFKHKSELISVLANDKFAGLSIGFVPTMGALHQGHLALIQQSINENDKSVCSIFVNPTQFNNPADLIKYPRQLEKDVKMLESINCDYLFMPEVEEMYSENEEKIIFNFGKLETVMEGADRPGHFQGVATIVKKLLEIVEPNKAYFGKKDFQQLMIIKSLQKQYNLSAEIIACDIVRDVDGLAMSSRNLRLNRAQRREAPLIYRTLCNAQELCKTHTIKDLIDWVSNEINSNPLMNLGYFEIADSDTLMPISSWGNYQKAMAFIVVNMGEIRLIDNVCLTRTSN